MSQVFWHDWHGISLAQYYKTLKAQKKSSNAGDGEKRGISLGRF